MVEPIIYLGLEIKQRELEPRLRIAINILQQGYPVVFGQQWALFMNAGALPPGVILFKTVNRIQAQNMASFKAAGHLVAATDEEVLVCFEDACFFEVFSEIAADNCNLFLAQSDTHKAAIDRRFPQLSAVTRVVGNCRVDMLSQSGRKAFAAEAAAIRAAHGRFILFNTNFGQINSIWADMNQVVEIAGRAGLVDLKNPDSVAEYRKKLDWEDANRIEITKLIDWALTRLTDYKIVLRPHPGERMEIWQETFGNRERFVLVPRSNPHPWVEAADVVVHTTCTTGLEAALLDKPVVNVVPVPHPTFDYITNYVNPSFKDWKEAATALDAYVKGKPGALTDSRARFEAALETHFPGHREGAATQKIAAEIAALLRANGAPPRPDYEFKFRGEFKAYKRTDVLKDKFSLSPEEFLERLQTATAGLPKPLKLQVAAMDDSLFYVRPV